MPKTLEPAQDEQEQDFISRFMASPDMMEEYGDEGERKERANTFWKERENSSSDWPITFKCSYIEPGLVAYADVGNVLVRKEVLDKMANSFVGKPVVNEEHKDVSPADFRLGKADGIVNSVWYDTDGKFHCAYQVWDSNTRTNIKNGYQVSCAYKVLRWGSGGVHNNIPYDREVLDGEYTHLAIVSNPRYEDVKIYNKGGRMTLKWLSKIMKDGKELVNTNEIETSNSKVEIDGKTVGLDECLNAFKEQQAKKEKDALKNQAPKDSDTIDLGNGLKATVSELKAAYAAKNAEEEKEKKEKDEAKNAEDEKEKKKKEDEALNAQRKNDMEKDHKDGKHDEKELKSCEMCNAVGRNHFDVIDGLANTRPSDKLNNASEAFGEFHDGFAEGARLFGSEKKTA